MKITILQLVNSIPALSHLANQPIPASIAFRLRRFIKATGPTVESFNEQRNELVKKLGTPVKDSSNYDFTKENAEIFNTEIKEMLEQEIEVPDFKLSEKDFEKVEVSAIQLAQLEYLIKE